jgi:hypothetical protein
MLPLPFPDLQTYCLTIDPDGSYTVAPTFLSTAVRRCGKIYMLTGPEGDATVHYIGQTSRSMTERIRVGITRQPGYRWAKQAGVYRLLVWILDKQPYASLDLESIEAELVLGVRVAQKAWPKWQTGIKFRHVVNRAGRQLAPHIAIKMLSQYYDEQLRESPGREFLLREKSEAIKILSGRIFPASA